MSDRVSRFTTVDHTAEDLATLDRIDSVYKELHTKYPELAEPVGPTNSNTYNGDQLPEVIDQTPILIRPSPEESLIEDFSNGSPILLEDVNDNRPFNSIGNGMKSQIRIEGEYSVNGEWLLMPLSQPGQVMIRILPNDAPDTTRAALAAGLMRWILLRNPNVADHYRDRIEEGISALEMLVEHAAEIV